MAARSVLGEKTKLERDYLGLLVSVPILSFFRIPNLKSNSHGTT